MKPAEAEEIKRHFDVIMEGQGSPFGINLATPNEKYWEFPQDSRVKKSTNSGFLKTEEICLRRRKSIIGIKEMPIERFRRKLMLNIETSPPLFKFTIYQSNSLPNLGWF